MRITLGKTTRETSYGPGLAAMAAQSWDKKNMNDDGAPRLTQRIIRTSELNL